MLGTLDFVGSSIFLLRILPIKIVSTPAKTNLVPANNTCGYSDPELDKMLEEERNLPDGDEREQLIIDIQKYIRDHVPYLTFDNPTNIVGVRTYVEGFRALPPTDQYYNNVSIIGTNN